MEERIKNIQQCLTECATHFLQDNPYYANKLNRFEFSVYSQAGEDGIIEEIFNRIGVENKRFVEIGIGNGDVTNTAYLLTKGWSGFWVEMNEKHFKRIRDMFSCVIGKTLLVKHAAATAENVERLLGGAGLPTDFDLLSIDIDGNDFWIWNALETYKPRVVVIEYNAMYPPHIRWVMQCNPEHRYDGSRYHGASLRSLAELGVKKGYVLVACNFAGVSAFFVKSELWDSPLTPEECYEPLRKWTINVERNRRDFDDFMKVNDGPNLH